MKQFKDYFILEQAVNLDDVIYGSYTVSSTGLVDVNGHVDLDNKQLTKIPFEFGNVSGNFSCEDNQLSSLKGSPIHVGGGFNCNDNELTTLEGAPETVGGYFTCSNNRLLTLKGAPKKVGGWVICYDNPDLYSIEDANIDRRKLEYDKKLVKQNAAWHKMQTKTQLTPKEEQDAWSKVNSFF